MRARLARQSAAVLHILVSTRKILRTHLKNCCIGFQELTLDTAEFGNSLQRSSMVKKTAADSPGLDKHGLRDL